MRRKVYDYSLDKQKKYCKNKVFYRKIIVMGRPIGSKNKTPQELKTEAELLKKKAEMMELERKRKLLQEQRRQGPKNGK